MTSSRDNAITFHKLSRSLLTEEERGDLQKLCRKYQRTRDVTNFAHSISDLLDSQQKRVLLDYLRPYVHKKERQLWDLIVHEQLELPGEDVGEELQIEVNGTPGGEQRGDTQSVAQTPESQGAGPGSDVTAEVEKKVGQARGKLQGEEVVQGVMPFPGREPRGNCTLYFVNRKRLLINAIFSF